MDTNSSPKFLESRDLFFLKNEYLIPRLFCVQGRVGLDSNWMVFVVAILCLFFSFSGVDV